MKGFLKEFKAFAMRGNVLDMAIGIVIGGAFSAIVTSLVNDLIMPLVGLITGGTNFTAMKLVLNEASGLAISYGNFIQAIVNFLIIAFSVFVAIKLVSKLHKKEEVKEEAPKVDETVELLKEIRDTLKNR